MQDIAAVIGRGWNVDGLGRWCGLDLGNGVVLVRQGYGVSGCILEHISQCGKVLYKDAKEFQQWFEEMRLVLLQSGFTGIDERLRVWLGKEHLLPKEREAVQLLRDYLERHRGRMNYRERC